MKLRPLSTEELRRIDARSTTELHLPTLVLMENAGRGAADWLGKQLHVSGINTPRVVVACGPGNNGGDGAVVARHLDAAGVSVRVAWFADPARLKGDAATQRDILDRSGIDQIVVTDPDAIDPLWQDAEWLVDALLGTGLARPVEGIIAHAIASLNRAGRPILALDLPSGLDADTGQPLGDAIRANATATFVAPKLGFDAALAYTGEVVVCPIGVPRIVLEPFAAGP